MEEDQVEAVRLRTMRTWVLDPSGVMKTDPEASGPVAGIRWRF